MQEKILIIDFGSQYTQLIARRQPFFVAEMLHFGGKIVNFGRQT